MGFESGVTCLLYCVKTIIKEYLNKELNILFGTTWLKMCSNVEMKCIYGQMYSVTSYDKSIRRNYSSCFPVWER